MKNAQRVIGQILLAVGITLAICGFASFLFEKVELRFLGNIITDETGRIIWVIANMVLASTGYYLWRSSQTTDRAA
jgi:hypothetical protein